MESAYLLPVALIPVAIMLIYIYKSETFEKEPIHMLITLLILGALSCIPIMIVEEAIGKDIQMDLYSGAIKDQYTLAFRMAFLCAALTEEFFKFLFMFLYTWKKKEFNYKFDGIVYAAFTSMGFAGVENVIYLFRYNEARVILLRAVTSIPGHLMFSVFMGYFYGRARFAKSLGNSGGCYGNLIMSLLSAIGLHGFYDFCLMTGDETFVTIFYVFIISMDIFTIVLVRKSAKRNHAIFQSIPLFTGQYRPMMMNGGAAALSPAGYGMGGQRQPMYRQPVQGMQQRPMQARDMRPVAGPRVPGQMPMQGMQQRPMQGMQQRPMQNGQFAPGAQRPMQGMQQRPMQGQGAFQPNAQFGQQSQQNAFQPNTQSQQGNFYIEPDANEEKTVGLFSIDNGPDMAEEATMSLLRLSEESAMNEFRTIGTVGRQQKRFITCPLCGAVNLFEAFHCKSCGSSLHAGF